VYDLYNVIGGLFLSLNTGRMSLKLRRWLSYLTGWHLVSNPNASGFGGTKVRTDGGDGQGDGVRDRVPGTNNPRGDWPRLISESAEIASTRVGTPIAVGVTAMRKTEYVLSVVMALLVLTGMVAWTQVSTWTGETALSCRPGKPANAVVLRGMSLYPRCPGGKQG
jgi:hypothetical protein